LDTFHAVNTFVNHVFDKTTAYSKLNMGPFFAELMEHILPVVNEEAQYEDRVRPPAKLAIYSGHDSTLAGVLSSLGPRVWNGSEPIAYASMMLIEVRREK
jgi:hypothetical protein